MWIEPGIMIPDGAGYVVYLPSTYLDHDLLFFNEWQRLGLIRNGIPVFKSVAPTGYLGNHWTVGPSMLWYPAFIVSDVARNIVPALRMFARDGIRLPYNLAVIAGSAFAGLGTLLIGYRVARRWFSASASWAAAIAIWFGTTLAWYSVRDAAMSHAASALACALVVLLSLRLRESPTTEAAFSAGLAVGFAALVRIQNAAFVIVPIVLLAVVDWRVLARRAHTFVAGGLLGVLPELVVSSFIYGHPLGFASIGVRAIGWYPWTRFWGVETLFSWYHGLFSWTPLAAFGVIGVVLFWRLDRPLAAVGALSFVIQWITNASADRAFWAANSFGARRFDNCTIFFLLGVATLIAKWPRIVIPIAAICCGWTMLLFLIARRVDLNAYQNFGELVTAIRTNPLTSDFGVLVFVRSMRTVTLALLIVLLAVNVAIAAAILKASARLRVIAAACYFAVMTAFLAWCGINGSSRIERYSALIARSRAFHASAGDEIGEENLLQNELLYLRKSGRTAEAAADERELHELFRRRAAAFRAAGVSAR